MISTGRLSTLVDLPYAIKYYRFVRSLSRAPTRKGLNNKMHTHTHTLVRIRIRFRFRTERIAQISTAKF